MLKLLTKSRALEPADLCGSLDIFKIDCGFLDNEKLWWNNSKKVIIYVHKQLITILLEGLLLDFSSKAGGHIVPICCDHIGPIGQVREIAYATVHGCKGKYH